MKKLKCFDIEDVIMTSKDTVEPGPIQEIIVPSSPLGNLDTPGRKCSHGVYIPANQLDQVRAEYCSLCRPHVIKLQEDSGAPVSIALRANEVQS